MADSDFVVDPAYANADSAGFVHAAGKSTIGESRHRLRKGRCKANGDTCRGFAQRGSDQCYGHNRQDAADAKRKAEAEVEVEDSE